MSVNKWAYNPEKCDGDICIGDCDRCYKASLNKLINKDVVHVVRCKDCRLYNTDNCYMIHGQRMNRDLFEDDYCSYGEREEV